MLHSDGQVRRHYVNHRLHAIGHQRRLGHQARTERATLHPLGRTATIQIDFVIAPIDADFRCARQIVPFATPDLQRDWMLNLAEAQMSTMLLRAAVNQRPRRDHLGVEPRVWRQHAE